MRGTYNTFGVRLMTQAKADIKLNLRRTISQLAEAVDKINFWSRVTPTANFDAISKKPVFNSYEDLKNVLELVRKNTTPEEFAKIETITKTFEETSHTTLI